MPKVLSYKQLMKKNYKIMEDVPDKFRDSFGEVVGNFKMLVWGDSGNGKSNLIFQLIQVLIKHGKVMYLSLEEGHEVTTQRKVAEYFNEEDNSNLRFADHTMVYDELCKVLKKRNSPKFLVIDSVQYWNISYEDYKALKRQFPTKGFIFISHANGKAVDGKVAAKIKYDAGIKVWVEGYVGFIKTSRYGGKKKPYVIWEEGAKHHYGKKYRSIVEGVKSKPTRQKKTDTTN